MSIKEYKKQFIELMIKLEEEHGPVKEISLVADRRDFNYWPSEYREAATHKCEIRF